MPTKCTVGFACFVVVALFALSYSHLIAVWFAMHTLYDSNKSHAEMENGNSFAFDLINRVQIRVQVWILCAEHANVSDDAICHICSTMNCRAALLFRPLLISTNFQVIFNHNEQIKALTKRFISIPLYLLWRFPVNILRIRRAGLAVWLYYYKTILCIYARHGGPFRMIKICIWLGFTQLLWIKCHFFCCRLRVMRWNVWRLRNVDN